MRKRAVMAAAAGLGLVAVFTVVQLSLIEPAWSTQQWVLAVVLPLSALITMVFAGLALRAWWRNGANSANGAGGGTDDAGPPQRGRYRARHAWQTRRWLARTSPIMGEPEAVAVRIR